MERNPKGEEMQSVRGHRKVKGAKGKLEAPGGGKVETEKQCSLGQRQKGARKPPRRCGARPASDRRAVKREEAKKRKKEKKGRKGGGKQGEVKKACEEASWAGWAGKGEERWEREQDEGTRPRWTNQKG